MILLTLHFVVTQPSNVEPTYCRLRNGNGRMGHLLWKIVPRFSRTAVSWSEGCSCHKEAVYRDFTEVNVCRVKKSLGLLIFKAGSHHTSSPNKYYSMLIRVGVFRLWPLFHLLAKAVAYCRCYNNAFILPLMTVEYPGVHE